MFLFTADEHYGHANIIRHCKRPFADFDEMDAALIARHNAVVGAKDTVIHIGDFTLRDKVFAATIIRPLHGHQPGAVRERPSDRILTATISWRTLVSRN